MTTTSHALAVAERLLDPATTVRAVGEADAASLNRGLAGTALLHARLSTIDPTFANAAIRHWTEAAGHLRRHPAGLGGIQGGRGGLAASLIIGSAYLPDPEEVRAITARSAAWLSAHAIDVCHEHYRMRSTGTGAQWHTYDAITGLAGIGRVLLAAAHDRHTGAEHGLEATLETLTALLAPCESPRPGWWLSRAGHPVSVSVDASGAATTGLAHGVAGPLALLSTAHTAGWSVPGQAEAITHAATWLLTWRTPQGTWPPHVTGTELDNRAPPQQHGRNDAWCYGTPGIARALHIAGRALRSPDWLQEAHEALKQFAQRAPNEWDTDGPTLCHGYAGVLQSTAQTSPSIASTAGKAVIDTFDPATAFGFQHHARSHIHNEPGFLTGASGVALALIDHTDPLTSSGDLTSWDCLLNLS